MMGATDDPFPAIDPVVPAPTLCIGGVPTMAFQPAVDLVTGRLLGFEALLRWPDTEGNAIPPAEVIAWAKAHGEWAALNRWVIDEACTQATRWPSQLQVAVNCTDFQLQDREGVMAVLMALHRTGLNPDRLTIEVTEVTASDQTVTEDLCAIGANGIQVSVDDLVSEDSIQEHLKDRAVNTVKIDGSLVSGLTLPGDRKSAIVERVVQMSRSLGISTVAEAVETREQVALLREIGVDAAQGFFFCAPLNASRALELAATIPIFHFDLNCSTSMLEAG